MLAVAPFVVVAGLLLVEPVDLDPEDGGGFQPPATWYEAACRSWREHLSLRISALRTETKLDASDAAQFHEVIDRTGEACVAERWRGLRLFASLDRALGEWSSPASDDRRVAAEAER